MGFPPPSVSDRTGPFPAPSSLWPEGRRNFASGARAPPIQFPEAEDRSSDTPGPMVEDSDTFFR